MSKKQLEVIVKRKICSNGPTLLEKLIEYIKEQEVKRFDSRPISNESS